MYMQHYKTLKKVKSHSHESPVQRQYIFIHDAIVEKLRVGDTEIGIQNLRRRHKELLAQDSHTGSSPMEQEYKVRVGVI